METNLLKALALMQYNSEPYMVIQEDDDFAVFIGSKEELENEYNKREDVEQTFWDWCQDNAEPVEPIDDSEHGNHMVLTDEEADRKAREYILETAWAFNPSWLSSFTGFDEDIFKAIQENGKCESNNSAILALIENEDEFVSQAIRDDGRGHFITSYDGNENEETVTDPETNERETFYIYRMH